MAIRFKYDAAAVVPPSNKTTREFGQKLVTAEQQRKYEGQQRGYDRLFTLGRDVQQNTWQAGRDQRQKDFQVQLATDQQSFLTERDEAQNKFLLDQQRKKDFDAARGRMDAYAKDALNNPDLPQELRQRIQNLISGKMTALGGGFDGPAQQEFLDQYNAQLAAILSEVPAPKPKAPPEPNFHTDPNGNEWVEEGPGKWKQVPPQEQRPTSVDDAIRKDPKALDSYLKYEIDAQTDGGKKGLTPEGLDKARERARKQYEKDLGLGTPTDVPTLPGAAAPAVPGTERSILEREGEPAPPPAPAEDDLLGRLDAARRAQEQQGIPIAAPDVGQPPSPPPAPPARQQFDPTFDWRNPTTASEKLRAHELDVEMNKQGYYKYYPGNGEQPFYLKEGQSSTTPAPPPSSPAQGQPPAPTQQNAAPGVPPDVSAKVEAFVAGQSPDEALPGFQAAQKQLENNGMKVPGTSSSKPPAAPDFKSAIANAEDDLDRGAFVKLQGIYPTATPEVQAAIGVVFGKPSPKELAKALDYLKAAGIDLDELAPTGTDRLNEYQNNLTTTMR